MATYSATTSVKHAAFSETVFHEWNQRYSRRKITIAASTACKQFAVLYRTTDGSFKPVDAANAAKARAILISNDVKSSEATQEAIALIGHCCVSKTNIVFPEDDDFDDAAKKSAIFSLEDFGFILTDSTEDNYATL